MPSRRYYIQGRVQGVWFRATTRDKAQELGLSGFVRNLADGRVEVLADGTEEQLQAFEDYLSQGPPLARVKDVEQEQAEAPEEPGFRVTG